MPSALGLVSLGCLLGALVVVAVWFERRRDALGRPRSFPAWTAMVLVVLALVAAIPGAQRRAHEHRLASVVRQLIGQSVTVHCQSTAGALVDTGDELGFVPYGDDGVPLHTTTLKRDPCAALRAYLSSNKQHPSLEQVTAVHVLTHEAMHMRGETVEAVAECEAVQRDEQTASLLGANDAQATALAREYWTQVYPRMPDEYRTSDCAPAGSLDENLPGAPWSVTP